MSSQAINNQELEIPEFKSEIPAVLLDGVSEKERHILNTLSIIQQQNHWQASILAQTFRQTVRTNGRVGRLEEKDEQKQLIINELVKDVAENKECTKDFKDIKGLLNKKWFVFGGAMIAIFIAFFVYPYFLSLHFKDLLPALKGFFSFLS